MQRIAVIGPLTLLAITSLFAAPHRYDRLSLVGLWRRLGHVRVFYGSGEFFIDQEPEGRPVGRWKLHGDTLSIQPPGAHAENAERIVTLTRSRMTVITADGGRHTYERIEHW